MSPHRTALILALPWLILAGCDCRGCSKDLGPSGGCAPSQDQGCSGTGTETHALDAGDPCATTRPSAPDDQCGDCYDGVWASVQSDGVYCALEAGAGVCVSGVCLAMGSFSGSGGSGGAGGATTTGTGGASASSSGTGGTSGSAGGMGGSDAGMGMGGATSSGTSASGGGASVSSTASGSGGHGGSQGSGGADAGSSVCLACEDALHGADPKLLCDGPAELYQALAECACQTLCATQCAPDLCIGDNPQLACIDCLTSPAGCAMELDACSADR